MKLTKNRGSEAAQLYIAVVVATATVIAVGLAIIAWRLGPPIGDLTRMAGASERDYGWQGKVEGFEKDRYDRIQASALLSGSSPGDILVLGDSFSRKQGGGISWVNTTVTLTGLLATYVRIKNFQFVLDYLHSRAYRENPPKAIIVQSIERALLSRAIGIYNPSASCEAPQSPAKVRVNAEVPYTSKTLHFSRRTQFESIDELISRGQLAFRRGLISTDNVLTVKLTRSNLFTHAAKNHLLLFADDVRNHLVENLPTKSLDYAKHATLCGLRQLVTAAKQRTPIFLVVAPDKRSVYAPWIATPLPQKALNIFALTKNALGTVSIDLLKALTSAVKAGERDIYWPDDTHWGAVGNRIVGETIAQQIVDSMKLCENLRFANGQICN